MSDVVCLEEVASFPLKGSAVSSMTALPGGLFATGHDSPDNAVLVWTPTGNLLATLEGHTGFIAALACTPLGDIVSSSWDHCVRVWRDSTCVHTLRGHDNAVRAVAVSPLDGTIVSGSGDTTAKVWSASRCLATLAGHADSLRAVCVLDNGDVATGSYDKTVRIWERGSWVCTAVHKVDNHVHCMAVVPGVGLAVGGGAYRGGGFVSLWRGGRREWSVATATYVFGIAATEGKIIARCHTSAFVIKNGCIVQQLAVLAAQFAVLSTGSIAAVTCMEKADSEACRVFRLVRPSRMATVRIMIIAWSAHGGVPPPRSDGEDATAVLARTLSLRRFCRVRGGEKADVVEPFARDIVGFM